MIELDGSYGEGGGALVRTALALSVLTGKEFSVKNIRAGREQGGLKAQHLQAIMALKQFCNAETNEVQVGSTELWFKPGKMKRGIFSIDIGTAGSISLLLQALVLPSMFAPGKVTWNITGGTCGKWQAPIDYIQNVLVPQLQRFVEKIEVKIMKRGYYPAGGGMVRVEITPRFSLATYDSFEAFYEELPFKVPKIIFSAQGKLEQIRGVVDVSSSLQEKEVGERIQHAVESSLKQYNVPVTVRVEYASALSPGGNVTLWALYSTKGKVDVDNPVILGADVILEKEKTAEQMGKQASEKLQKELNAGVPVDHYITDQIIPFLGLLPGSKMAVKELTPHARTNVYVAEKFLPIAFKEEENVIYVEKVN